MFIEYYLTLVQVIMVPHRII